MTPPTNEPSERPNYLAFVSCGVEDESAKNEDYPLPL